MVNGDTSFTFSLLTFSWSRPNKGRYSVANRACWLWKKKPKLISQQNFPGWRTTCTITAVLEDRQESAEITTNLLWRCSAHQMCVLSSNSSTPGWQPDESPWTPAGLHWPPWGAAPPGSGSCRSHLLASNPAGGLGGGRQHIRMIWLRRRSRMWQITSSTKQWRFVCALPLLIDRWRHLKLASKIIDEWLLLNLGGGGGNRFVENLSFIFARIRLRDWAVVQHVIVSAQQD